jgi:hypothetical protein
MAAVFKRGARVVVVASDRYPATVGKVGEVRDASALHGERIPPGELAVDGIRDPELDLRLGPPTYLPHQLRSAD